MPPCSKGKSLSQGVHPSLPPGSGGGGLRNLALGWANMAPSALPSLRPRSSSPLLGGPSSEQGRVSGPQADRSPTLVTCCLPLPAHSGQILPSADQRRRDAPPEGHDQDGDRAAGDQGNGPVSDWQCFCLEPRLGEPRTQPGPLVVGNG